MPRGQYCPSSPTTLEPLTRCTISSSTARSPVGNTPENGSVLPLPRGAFSKCRHIPLSPFSLLTAAQGFGKCERDSTTRLLHGRPPRHLRGQLLGCGETGRVNVHSNRHSSWHTPRNRQDQSGVPAGIDCNTTDASIHRYCRVCFPFSLSLCPMPPKRNLTNDLG